MSYPFQGSTVTSGQPVPGKTALGACVGALRGSRRRPLWAPRPMVRLPSIAAAFLGQQAKIGPRRGEGRGGRVRLGTGSAKAGGGRGNAAGRVASVSVGRTAAGASAGQGQGSERRGGTAPWASTCLGADRIHRQGRVQGGVERVCERDRSDVRHQAEQGGVPGQA